MKITTTLNRNYLRAALLCAAKKGLRYYLIGVSIEIHAGHAMIVSCDGHRLLVCRDNGSGSAEHAGTTYIIPYDVVKAIKAIPYDTIEVTYDTESKTVTMTDCGTTWGALAIDGMFPDWRRVVPSHAHAPSGNSAQFDTEYVADFGKINKILGAKNPIAYIHHDGEAVAVISTCDENVIGLLMPIRQSACEYPFPDMSVFTEPLPTVVSTEEQSS